MIFGTTIVCAFLAILIGNSGRASYRFRILILIAFVALVAGTVLFNAFDATPPASSP